MSRQSKLNWTKIGVMVTIFLAGIGLFFTIMLSDLDITTKEIGSIGLALVLYILYNELQRYK